MRKLMGVFVAGALLASLASFSPARAESETASTVTTLADEGSKDAPVALDEKKNEGAKADEKEEPSEKKDEKIEETATSGKTEKVDENALKTEKKEEPKAADKKDEVAKKEPVKEDPAAAAKKDAKKEEAKKEVPAKSGSAASEMILFENTGKLAPVNFSHKLHGEKNACKACHEGDKPLFEQKVTKTGMKMADMYAGKLCGACHDGKDKHPFEAKKSCAKCHAKK